MTDDKLRPSEATAHVVKLRATLAKAGIVAGTYLSIVVILAGWGQLRSGANDTSSGKLTTEQFKTTLNESRKLDEETERGMKALLASERTVSKGDVEEAERIAKDDDAAIRRSLLFKKWVATGPSEAARMAIPGILSKLVPVGQTYLTMVSDDVNSEMPKGTLVQLSSLQNFYERIKGLPEEGISFMHLFVGGAVYFRILRPGESFWSEWDRGDVSMTINIAESSQGQFRPYAYAKDKYNSSYCGVDLKSLVKPSTEDLKKVLITP